MDIAGCCLKKEDISLVSTTAKKVNKVHIETGLAVEDDKWPQ
jgi:hypothetical protein